MLAPTLVVALVLATMIKGVPRDPRVPAGFMYSLETAMRWL